MSNQVSAFKVEFFNLLSTTTNLDAATKTLIRNAFVTEYAFEWQTYLTGGGTDTATNRASFAIERTFDFWRRTVQAASYKANVAALPAPTDIT